MPEVTPFRYPNSTLETSPIVVEDGKPTVPVKVGEASGAFNKRSLFILSIDVFIFAILFVTVPA